MKLFHKAGALLGALALSTAAHATTWYQSSDYVVNGGPIAAPAAGGALGSSGLVDVTGGNWSVNSSNQLVEAVTSPSSSAGLPTGILAHNYTENSANQREVVNFVGLANAAPAAQPSLFVALRYSGTASSATEYGIGGNLASTTGTNVLQLYKIVGNSVVTVSGAPAPAAIPNLTPGAIYTLDVNIVGTTMTAAIYNLSGTQVGATYTITDGGTAIAGPGKTALFVNVGTGAAQPITRITTYTDTAAAVTSYSLSGPSSGNVATASSAFTVTANGTLSSNVVVTESDGSTGTFSPPTLTLTSAAPTGTFTYTPPATAATYAISATNNGGLTNPPPVSYAAAQASITIPVTSAAFKFSPGDWRGDAATCPGGVPAYRCGSVYRQTWHEGAWLQVVWNASASPSAALLMPASSTTTTLSYIVNGIETDNLPISAGTQTIITAQLIPNARNVMWVYVRRDNAVSLWGASATDYAQIQGLQIDGGAGSSVGAADPVKPWVKFAGDSQSNGTYQDCTGTGANSCSNALHNYTFYLGQALEAQGFDYGVTAAGGDGWIVPGGGGVIPYYQVSGGAYVPGNSRWNKIDYTASLLDSLGHESAYGSTGQEPAAIVIDLMSNDAAQSASISDATAAVTQDMVAERNASPNAWLFLIVPYGLNSASTISWATSGTYRSALLAGFNAYVSAHPADTKVKMVDLGASVARQMSLSGTGFSADASGAIGSPGVHYTGASHAVLAQLDEPQIIGALAGTVVATIAAPPPAFRRGFH